jgi:V8-like Glu-specific endopeptidase
MKGRLMPGDKSQSTRVTKQSEGKSPPTPKGKRGPAPARQKANRVSNREVREAREAARAEAAGAGKGEAELPSAGGRPSDRLAAVVEAAADRPVLPAWVASYTNHGTMALLRRTGTQPSAESIPQTGDDRQRVSDTEDVTAFPWKCLCRLDIYSQNGNAYLGTGWLAGPRTVITAGHCVYLHDDGGWAARIRVTPDYNEGDAPFGSFDSSDLQSTDTWVNGNPDDPQTQFNDYGAILLPQPLSVGYFGYGSLGDGDLLNAIVNVFGYPADKDMGSALWGHYRQLYRVTANQLFYSIATIGGESGSPVFIKDGDKRTVVGIHNYGGDPANKATRITDDVYDNIQAWVG